MSNLHNTTVSQLLVALRERVPELTAEQIARQTGFEPKQILEMLDGKPPARAQGKKTTSKARGYVYAKNDERYLKLGALLVEYGQGLVENAESFRDLVYAEQGGSANTRAAAPSLPIGPGWLVADDDELDGTIRFALSDELRRCESRAESIRHAQKVLRGKSADDVNGSTDPEVIRAAVLGRAFAKN